MYQVRHQQVLSKRRIIINYSVIRMLKKTKNDNYDSISGSENSSQINYNSGQMLGTKKGSLTYRNKNSNYDRKSGGLSIENS